MVQGPFPAALAPSVSRAPGSARDVAQASQSAAGISLTEGTASRVISDEAIKAPNIVHRTRHFKGVDACQVPGTKPSKIIWSA